MTTLQSIVVGGFLLLYYYYVLRKYNTLGFRLFSLCFFTGLSVCYWWSVDYLALTDVQTNGIATQATVLKKSPDRIDVRFTDQAGKSMIRSQTDGISIDEFASVQEGRPTPILYSPQSDTFYLTSSYQRQRSDTLYFLYFPASLFLLGILCWVFLRKYRVHPHEGTIYEYVTDESGRVVLDDARNSTTKSLRNYATMSKLFQLFD